MELLELLIVVEESQGLLTKIKMKKENKKSLKEIGVWTVTCWISAGLAVLMSVFSAVVTIKAGQILIGLLFFIPGIFAAVPKKYLRISRALKVIIFIVVYFTLIIISGLNAPEIEQQYEYYNLEQPFDLTFGENIFSMKIDNITKETQMMVDDEKRTTPGIFLLVHGSVTNLGKIATDFGFYSELKDNQNNSYSIISFQFDKGGLQPNLEKNFFNVFEMPKDASGLNYIVKDETNIIKVINLEK